MRNVSDFRQEHFLLLPFIPINQRTYMNNPIREKKLKIIALYIEALLNENPHRSLEWYGNIFDNLYDKGSESLEKMYNIYILMDSNKRKKNPMTP